MPGAVNDGGIVEGVDPTLLSAGSPVVFGSLDSSSESLPSAEECFECNILARARGGDFLRIS